MANIPATGIAKQTAFGTPNTTFTPVKFTSIGTSALEITRVDNDELFGGLHAYAPTEGLRSASISVDGRAYPSSLGMFLNMTSTAVTTGAGPYEHVFEPNGTVPEAYTFGFDEASGIDGYFSDVRLTSLGFSQEVGAPLTFSVSGIGTDRTTGAVTVSTAGVETTPFQWRDLTTEIGIDGAAQATNANFKNLNISLDMPIENIYTLNGTNTPVTQEFTGMYAVTIDGTLRFTDDANSYRAAFEGDLPLAITLTWANADGDILVIDLPNVRLADHDWTRGREETVVNIAGAAFVDVASGKTIEFTLTNSTVSY